MQRDSALTRLVSGLRREPHDFRSSLQVFPDLNVGRIASELALETRGAERGAKNEPPSASAALDEVEVSIIERVEAEKKSAHSYSTNFASLRKG